MLLNEKLKGAVKNKHTHMIVHQIEKKSVEWSAATHQRLMVIHTARVGECVIKNVTASSLPKASKEVW